MDSIFWSVSDDESGEIAVEEEQPVGKRQKPDTGEAPSDEQRAVLHRLSAVDKAGLAGTANQIDKVIAQTKDSSFGRFEKLREERVVAKVQKLRTALAEAKARDAGADVLSAASRASVARQVNQTVQELLRGRVLGRTVLAVDFDAFYCSCEAVRRPQLRGKAFAVGGTSMLSASSYEARAFGVRSAMPGFLGLMLCPQLLILPPDFELYTQVSSVARSIFADYDPNFTTMSLDEACLDVSDYLAANSHLDGAGVAAIIRERVKKATQCTVSVGVGPNRPLAKIASNMNKPDGQFLVPADVAAFVRPMPLRKIPGIGPVAEATLAGIGMVNVQDLWDNRFILARVVKPSTLQYYLDISLGFPSWQVESNDDESRKKSVSSERTLSAAGVEGDEALAVVRDLCIKVAQEVLSSNACARTVTVKLKGIDFQVHSHQSTLAEASSSFDDIWPVAKRLFLEMSDIGRCRLVGVRLSNLT